MIDEQTIQKLRHLKLHAMADAVRELLAAAPGHGMSFEERLALVVDREWADRENRRLTRRLKEAKLVTSACLEDIWCEPGRGLDKDVRKVLSRRGARAGGLQNGLPRALHARAPLAQRARHRAR